MVGAPFDYTNSRQWKMASPNYSVNSEERAEILKFSNSNCTLDDVHAMLGPRAHEGVPDPM